MSSENTVKRRRQPAGTASENPQPLVGPPRRGRAPVSLPAGLAAAHGAYTAALARASLSVETRRTYASKVAPTSPGSTPPMSTATR